MIKNSQRQSGSAHVVIIVILVVALLGALGFIFYQNFIKQNNQTNNTTPGTTQKADDEQSAESYKGTRVAAISGVYSIKIPNGWSVIRNTAVNGSNIQQSMDAKLVYDESKAPVVKDEEIGGHDALIFSIGVLDTDYPAYSNETRTTFTTDSGIKGERVEGFTPASDEQVMYADYDLYLYRWTFSKNNGQVVYISWPNALTPGTKPDAALLSLLDDVARSLEIK